MPSRTSFDGGFRDWQLDFVGTIGPCSEDRAFVDKLANAAAGYPVHIRPDIESNELRNLYQKSPIYWHATGFGTSEAKQPGLQEHFGISIVEAMSAGAVPIAFNSGGPREVIGPGINGFLWNTPIELMEATVRLTKDPQLFKSMSEAAVLRSRGFVVDQYLARMDDIIERVMAAGVSPSIATKPHGPIENDDEGNSQAANWVFEIFRTIDFARAGALS